MKRGRATTRLGLVNGPVSGVRIANPAYGPTAPPNASPATVPAGAAWTLQGERPASPRRTKQPFASASPGPG